MNVNGLEFEFLVQRCVDGELDPAGQRQFLSSLEESGGREEWRRLALGFVENQVLGRELRVVADSLPDCAPASLVEPAPIVGRFRYLLAALLLLGVGLTGLGRRWLDSREVVPIATDSGNAPGHLPMQTEPTSPTELPTPSDPNLPVMNLTFVGMGESEEEAVSIPVYLPEQFTHQPAVSGVPWGSAWQSQLEAQGYAVERKQQYLSVPLDDGRQIIVPSETVRVKYAVH